MNKFILEINITNDNSYGLEIKIIHWDHRFLHEPTDLENYPFCYYVSDKDLFTLYSNNDGEIYNNVLEIPTLNNLKKNNILRYSFDTDFDRYEYLKNLYICLEEWTNNYPRFRNDVLKNDKIIISNNYWIN